jgi:anti-anti-sigma factor
MERAPFRLELSRGVAHISGELDVQTVAALTNGVLATDAVEVDLAGVTFMDSSGLKALLSLREARPNLRIVAVSAQVRHVLEITVTAEHLLDDAQTNADA